MYAYIGKFFFSTQLLIIREVYFHHRLLINHEIMMVKMTKNQREWLSSCNYDVVLRITLRVKNNNNIHLSFLRQSRITDYARSVSCRLVSVSFNNFYNQLQTFYDRRFYLRAHTWISLIISLPLLIIINYDQIRSLSCGKRSILQLTCSHTSVSTPSRRK